MHRFGDEEKNNFNLFKKYEPINELHALQLYDKLAFVKDDDKIPYGNYCYDYDMSANATIRCKYWDLFENKPKSMNGYCHYLSLGDWMTKETHGVEGTTLIFDECKECGVNK